MSSPRDFEIINQNTNAEAAKVTALLGAAGDTGGSETAGTLAAKLNALLSALENSAYGLSALKELLGTIDTKSSSNLLYVADSTRQNKLPISKKLDDISNATACVKIASFICARSGTILLAGGCKMEIGSTWAGGYKKGIFAVRNESVTYALGTQSNGYRPNSSESDGKFFVAGGSDGGGNYTCTGAKSIYVSQGEVIDVWISIGSAGSNGGAKITDINIDVFASAEYL